ncbi:MAG: hypothetical protein ACI4TR_01380 [Bacteroidaceae bacterium]
MKKRYLILLLFVVGLLSGAKWGVERLDCAAGDRLCNSVDDQREKTPATICLDAVNSVALGLPRPVRLVPPGFSVLSKMSGRRSFGTARQLFTFCLNVSPFNDLAPMGARVSRRYYVVALRHIVC